MTMDRKAAEEYSDSLGQIGSGWWRQVAWAHQQGIPHALGMTTKQWVEHYVGGWQKLSLPDRKQAVLELTAKAEEGGLGLSQRAAADVLGVDPATVNRDLRPEPTVADATPEPAATLMSEPTVADATPSTVALPTGRYRTIVIDPPWPMDKIKRQARPQQTWDGGEHVDGLDYRLMSLDDIKALPIGSLAESDGTHVYLWTTQRFLPDAFECFRAWGVKYQCVLTWVKNVGMTPFSWMYDTEHVLFGRIGNLDLLQKGLRLSFGAPISKHSEKPDVFYTKVAAASPVPRLDMFARRPRDGFEPWGDEVAA